MGSLAARPPCCILRGCHISPSHGSAKSTAFPNFTRRNTKHVVWSSTSDNGALSKQITSSLEDNPDCRTVENYKRSLESLFCYDKGIPEEVIEKPVGLVSLGEKNIGTSPRCRACETKGAVLCDTCAGSGLYIESILESQGILVKVRCLGCGGSGNIMCSECGGRGHL